MRRPRIRLTSRLVLFLTTAAVAAMLPAVYVLGTQFWRDHPGAQRRLERLKDRLLHPPEELLRCGLPVYDLSLETDALRTLLKGLPPEPDIVDTPPVLATPLESVKGRLTVDGRTYKVKVRFRGDGKCHWGFDKKSWRIKLAKEDRLDGYRVLNLINPRQPGFFEEAFAMALADRVGLMAMAVDFVVLRVNGQFQGLFMRTEPIDAAFLERRGRPVGNVFGERDPDTLEYGTHPIYEHPAYWRKYVEAEHDRPDNFAELAALLDLLADPDPRRFREQIFQMLDRPTFMRWQSLAMLLKSYHSDGYHNMRLYWDPTCGRFEIIPIDINPLRRTEWLANWDWPYNPLVTRILSEPEFMHERNRTLWSLVQDDTLLEFGREFIRQTNAKLRPAVLADPLKAWADRWYHRQELSGADYDQAVAWLESSWTKAVARVRRSLSQTFAHVTIHTPGRGEPSGADGALADLAILTRSMAALELKSIVVHLNEKTSPAPARLALAFVDTDRSGPATSLERSGPAGVYAAAWSGPLLHTRRDKDLKLVPTTYRFRLRAAGPVSPASAIAKVEVRLVNAVTGQDVEATSHWVRPGVLVGQSAVTADRDRFLAAFPAFQPASDSAGGVRLPAGRHVFTADVVVPAGLNLTIDPGARLEFGPGVSLYSFGPVRAVGTSEKPIVFTWHETGRPWGVLAVCRPEAGPCRFEHVIVEHGGQATVAGIHCTGALSLYGPEVTVRDSLFRFNTGDDALNVKYGRAEVTDCLFLQNAFDAVDYDFCPGLIARCRFVDNGNDAVDLGTAHPLVRDNWIEGCGDKGISLGERSRPIICNNVIRRSNVALAIKDLSDPLVVNNTLVGNAVAVGLYRKKLEYGGGRGTIVNTLTCDNAQTLQADSHSQPTVRHCSSEVLLPGPGNRQSRPRFANPGAGDYRLAADEAPLLQGGDPAALRQAVPDFAGATAPIGLYDADALARAGQGAAPLAAATQPY